MVFNFVGLRKARQMLITTFCLCFMLVEESVKENLNRYTMLLLNNQGIYHQKCVNKIKRASKLETLFGLKRFVVMLLTNFLEKS